MLQIKNTLGGGKPEGLYVWEKNEIGSELKEINESVSTLPYSLTLSSAVVLNGEIHILGSSNSTYYEYHYKFDGTSWTSVSTLPYSFRNGSAVVFNNEIHILGGASNDTNHYKWDGTSWTSVSTLPYNFTSGSAVVYDGEIHILGGNGYETNHYKFDGTTWTFVGTLPYGFYYGSAVVFNEEIHILGGNSSSSQTKHYKFDGTSWTSVSTLLYRFLQGSAVVYNEEIHILGSGHSYAYAKYHYKWDGSSWTSVSTLPYGFYTGSAVVYNNGIHILGGTGGGTNHYLIIGYAPIYTFLDYIVSDKETAYPDGGEKGGYWYEKVVDGIDLSLLGLSKSEQGSFTPTSNIKSYTINHNLGVKPKMFYLFRQGNTAGTTTYVKEGIWYTFGNISTTDYMYGTVYESYSSNQYDTSETNNIKRDYSQIALSFNRYLAGSSEYKWMAFA